MVRSYALLHEVLHPFVTNKKLIEGLAKSEISGFKAKDHVVWKVSFNSGTPVEATLTADDSRESLAPGFPMIGIPGGYIGTQAVYLLLENFWRNLVKHDAKAVEDKIKSNGSLTIHIDLRGGGDEYYQVDLWAEVRAEQKAVDTVNDRIKQGIVDATGKLNSEGWGSKEMLIAAAYLLAEPLQNTNNEAAAKELLTCELRPSGNGESYMKYSFKVYKPMDLFWVWQPGNGGKALTDKQQKELQTELLKHGIRVVDKRAPNALVPHNYYIGPEPRGDDHEAMLPLKRFTTPPDGCGVLAPTGLFENGKLDPEKRWKLLCALEEAFLKQLGHAHPLLILQGQNTDALGGVCCPSVEAKAGTARLSSPAEDEFVALFDHHGDLRKHNGNENYVARYGFYEPFSGGSATHAALSQVPDSAAQKSHLAWTILSSAALRIVILDERIQQTLSAVLWGFRSGQANTNPLECLKGMQVFVPRADNGEHSVCDLSQPKWESIRGYVQSIEPRAQVVTIHAGVIDKLGLDLSECCAELKGLLQAPARVVVHSGRGIPNAVPDYEVPYVSFGAVEHWVSDSQLKSKHALVQELLAARGVKRRN